MLAKYNIMWITYSYCAKDSDESRCITAEEVIEIWENNPDDRCIVAETAYETFDAFGEVDGGGGSQYIVNQEMINNLKIFLECKRLFEYKIFYKDRAYINL